MISSILPDSVVESKETPTLQFLKGVGPARAQMLAKMGLTTPRDLALYFPRDWEDRRRRYSIREAPAGEKTCLRGNITAFEFQVLRRNLGMANVTLSDGTGWIHAVWFKKMNPRYDVFLPLRQKLKEGLNIMVFGLVEMELTGRQMQVEEYAFLRNQDATLEPEDAWHLDRIVPLYTVTKGLSEKLLRSLIARIIPNEKYRIPTMVTQALEKKYGWGSKPWALDNIHFPKMLLDKEKARNYLAFEEFLLLEVALGTLRKYIKLQPKSHHYLIKKTILTPFRQGLRFEFTAAQKAVIREIFNDMLNPYPMNRLLQGDVGSGKTVVALCAMLLALENGGQAVLMAPTEILAEQHALTIDRWLKPLNIRWAVLTGRQSTGQRKKILNGIESGEIALVVGTHALIQKPVKFHKLTLAVVDEQHRFGVEHRSLLRLKGDHPDVLVMTATPIPRTLALTLYGDMDVSTLNELPPGRMPIATMHVGEEEAYREIHNQAVQGRQGYIVYPLVEESNKIELKAAVQEAEALRRSALKDLRVGLIHGQMKSLEKEAVMRAFRDGEYDVLIATSIIEVGIDVPNATVMVIQHAERFGLSSLHQLRGRVGRGSYPSSCLLVADTRSAEARRRIEIMTQTQDGFRLSEEDLKMRGPGEVLGVMQHGLPPFKIGDLIQDAPLIQQARRAAEEIIQHDPELKASEHKFLKRQIIKDYEGKWSLGLTG
jgi:ATP-dependent DNA helicase RecG